MAKSTLLCLSINFDPSQTHTFPSDVITFRFVGSFLHDKIHGEGTYTWADGDKYLTFFEWSHHFEQYFTDKNLFFYCSYVGSVIDGELHGHGIYTWADGERCVTSCGDLQFFLILISRFLL